MFSVLHKREQAHDDAIWTCAWAHSDDAERSDVILTGGLDNHVKLWHWDESEGLRVAHDAADGQQLGVISSDVSADGRTGVTAGSECALSIWALATGERRRTVNAGPLDSWSVRLSPDARSLATGTHSGKVAVYALESGERTATLDTNGKFVLCVAWSADGRRLAAGSQEGILYVFDVETHTLVSNVEAHALPIRTVSFTPDSEMLVSGSDDKYAKIHDMCVASHPVLVSMPKGFRASTHQLIGTLPGHTSWVLDLSISSLNNQIATCSGDHTVRVWDFAQRQTLHTFKEHSDQVWGVKFNHNGSRMVSVSEDKSMVVYNIPV